MIWRINMYSIMIREAVKKWLDERPTLRACGSCAMGCNDMERFICFGGSIKDIQDIMDSQELWDKMQNLLNELIE